jgi:hypothetical protein
MTIKEAAEQAAVLFREGLVTGPETVEVFARILTSLGPKDIPPSERAEVLKITALALAGEVDAQTFVRIAVAVLKCNKLFERSMLTVEEQSFFESYESMMAL